MKEKSQKKAGRPKGVKQNVSFWINPKYKDKIQRFIKTLEL